VNRIFNTIYSILRLILLVRICLRPQIILGFSDGLEARSRNTTRRPSSCWPPIPPKGGPNNRIFDVLGGQGGKNRGIYRDKGVVAKPKIAFFSQSSGRFILNPLPQENIIQLIPSF
jgi:hypothetical protein